jgi:hypothetical protein
LFDASFQDLEIKGIIINGMRIHESINFTDYDYIVYNNSVMQLNWFENNLNILGHYENIYLKYSLDGGDKTIWCRKFDICCFNKNFNESLRGLEEIKRRVKKNNERYEKLMFTIELSGENCEDIIVIIEDELPSDADKRQRDFFKSNRLPERISI